MATYYKCWLVAPLVVALISGFMQTALLVAGIPYFAFVVSALFWSAKRKDANYNLAFLLSPILFGCFCFAFGIVMNLFMNAGKGSVPEGFITGFGIASMGIIVSALFCVPALLLWHATQLVRSLIRPKDASS